MMVLSFTPVEATWTDIHQISSSSHTIQITGDGYNMPPENAYDGIGWQSGDPVLLRTDPCYTQSSPSQGSSIEIDYTLSTNQSSVPFNIQFRLTHVPTNAPDSYVSISIYNMNTQSYDEITNIGDQSGNDYNISRSSAYMDNAGNIYLNVFTGHGNQDCNSYAEVRFYEFFIYTDIVDEPNFDQDNDGIEDSMDSCPSGEINWISNPSTDHDGDGCKDDSTEDLDDDNDGISDDNDTCNVGDLFTSNSVLDYDGDGCKDDSEDNDDDNDGINDGLDQCEKGQMGWLSSTSNDYDQDGCLDSSNEDDDDDNDGIVDLDDGCNTGLLEWTSSQTNDYDSDGCYDDTEDDDDDGDTVNDGIDQCKTGVLNWISNGDADYDGDGCKDDNPEDLDDDNDGVNDGIDQCKTGVLNWISNGDTDYDGDGCKDDNPEDLDDDNDGVNDDPDQCEAGVLNWISNGDTDHDGDGCRDDNPEDSDDDNDNVDDITDQCRIGNVAFTGVDRDGDGCQDSDEDEDDDNDGLNDLEDNCDDNSSQLGWFSDPVTDYDSDGCKDETEDLDDDNDGVNDVDNNSQALDMCQRGELGWISNSITDYDRDGCSDNVEDNDNDNDDVNNNLDKCPNGALDWTSNPDSDFDNDGCKDDDLEDLDDDNDNVSDSNDDCPKSPPRINVGNDGCAIEIGAKTTGQDNGLNVNEIAGISIIVILAIAIIAYFGGYLTHSIINDDEIEATSAELIEYIENLEEHIASADKNLLSETNGNYREVIAYSFALVNKYRDSPKIKILTVEDVMQKMQKYGRCEVSGLVLLRALSTTLCRFHVNRLNYNGYEFEARRKDGRMYTGKQIMKELNDVNNARKGQKMKLKKWIVSTNKSALFPDYYNMLKVFDEVIHPEDYDKIKSYENDSFSKHCTIITEYLKILINHPEYPYPNPDQTIEAKILPNLHR